jgi:chromosome segregation ATPase
MFVVLRNMEVQLGQALSLNSLLEKDLSGAKERIIELKKENGQLQGAVDRMEDEIPSKRALRMEVEQLIEERNQAEQRIRDLKRRGEQLNEVALKAQDRAGELEGERKDAIAEINFLESRLSAAYEKISECEEQLDYLRRERQSGKEKVKSLEKDLEESLNEKFKALKALKDSQKAVTELHATLEEKKLQAQKAFYKSGEESRGEDA